MADGDRRGEAWRRAPSSYLESRPPVHEMRPPTSTYVEMRDGCRLAVDVHLPAAEAASSGGVPTILILTPYYRRFALRDTAPAGVEASPNVALYRDLFTPRGYAVVAVDVRGTGASFGVRDSFRSPVEREDFREIADWVVAQPWSDGTIGSTGISYLGAAACFLASTGHPAVKAIAPLSGVWNTYTDHFYPGGVLLNKLAAGYDELMVGLDHDRRDILARLPYFSDPNFAGPQPVDEDPDGALLRMATKEHLANFHMPEFISEFQFADDRLPYDPSFSAASFSPFHYARDIPQDVAVYSISGWMDGAAYANGSIARFLSLPGEKRRLLLGAWDHGARTDVSPWRAPGDPQSVMMNETLRFFDHYLMGVDTGLQDEAPVHYFTIHEEVWRAAATWPPIETARTLYLGADGALLPEPGAEGESGFTADFAAGTGVNTRHERLAAINVATYYPDWEEHERPMHAYTSQPLDAAATITGHPVVTLHLVSSQPDAVLHVYLSELEADGALRYVTEGVFRALHRQESAPPPEQNWSWPFHDFSRAKARPLTPGEPARLRFALAPTSWTFAKGSRIRLSIAGADCDHYVQLPHGRPPRLSIMHGGDAASAIELPWSEESRKAQYQQGEETGC
ncbi:CocE/NonD family hydrolase [Pikeienuella sp. HZG-20]|uniref:CocE/NonD family hydrolase n=1 Tax=Paludibacillus litoralis TaxID=3133267 RepID=UPI0030ED8A53